MAPLLPSHAPLSLARSPRISPPSCRAAAAGLTAITLLLVAALTLLLVSVVASSSRSSSATISSPVTTFSTVDSHDYAYRRHLAFAVTTISTWNNERSSGELVQTNGLKGFVTSLTINFNKGAKEEGVAPEEAEAAPQEVEAAPEEVEAALEEAEAESEEAYET